MNTFRRNIFPWVVCTIGAFFYCYAYFLRISPSAMMTDIMAQLHITASAFGVLTACYYYAYTPMQLPVGVMIDRFGARIVLFCACLIATLGLYVFIRADLYWFAALGRFLIGFGTAFAYITVLKLASIWLPPNRFAMVAGSTTSLGKIAACMSNLYLVSYVDQVGYKLALYYALFVGLALSLLILLVVRNKPRPEDRLSGIEVSEHRASTREIVSGMVGIFRNPQMWLIGIVGMLLYLPASVFLDVWGLSYLRTVHGLSSKTAGHAINMIFFGWIVAAPIIGAISDMIKLRRLPLLLSAIGASIIVTIIFYLPGLSTNALFVLLFGFGVFCGSHPLCFSLSKENNPRHLVGSAVAITNSLIMAGGVIFQPLVGVLLDFHSTGVIQNGVPVYTTADYTFALSVLPIAMVIAIIITLFIKETHCRTPDASPVP